MTIEPQVTESVMDMVQEDHLRLAFLFNLLEDELDAGTPVAPRLAELCFEYSCHAQREERALATHCPDLLAEHRLGHQRMTALLAAISADYNRGANIRPALEQVEVLFTSQLTPADAVFQGMSSTPL
jgi:hypothetical protein